MFHQRAAGLCTSVLFGLGLAVGASSASAQSCADETTLRSDRMGQVSELTFINQSREGRRIYWIDSDGRRMPYGVVEAGNAYQQVTSADHAWVVTDESDKCLLVVVAGPIPTTVDVTGPTASGVVPPPPGTQQAIGRGPASAKPVSAEISPIEAFELSGAYRLTPRNDDGKSLNNQTSGVPENVKVRPDWDSGQWLFEEVAGTSYVRIRNKWKGTYLRDDRGRLRAAQAGRDEQDAHWSFDPVDGSPFVSFTNRNTDRTLITTRGEPELTEEVKRSSDAHWQLSPVGETRSQVVTAVSPRPRNTDRDRAYEAALDNCRELGGYWTGSSCKAYRGSRIRDCGRGWAWSEDAGECQWDGGDDRICPPWMVGRPPNCQADMVCRGGTISVSWRGHTSCHCPSGTSMWGDYPDYRCVRTYAGAAVIAVPIVGAIIGLTIYDQLRRNSKSKAAGGQWGGGPNKGTGGPIKVVAPPTGLKVTTPMTLITTTPPTTPKQPTGLTLDPGKTGKGGATTTTTTPKAPTGLTLDPGKTGKAGATTTTAPAINACKEGQSTTTGCTCVAPMSVTVGTTCGTRTTIAPTLPTSCGAGRTGTPPNCVSTDAKKAADEAAQLAKDQAAMKKLADDTKNKQALDDAAKKRNADAVAKAAAETARLKAEAEAKLRKSIAERDAAQKALLKKEADQREANQRQAAELEKQRKAQDLANKQRADAEAKRRADEAAGRQRAADLANKQKADLEAKRRAAEAEAKKKATPTCPTGQVFKDGACRNAP